MAIEINRIRPEDWAMLRDLRLASLRDSPDAFGQRLDEAALFDNADWRSLATRFACGNTAG